jgi:hypothetical protein
LTEIEQPYPESWPTKLPNEFEDFEGGKSKHFETDPEIDLEEDPMEKNPTSGPDETWEEKIRSIKVRIPDIPSAEEQQKRIAWILGMLDSEQHEPTAEQVSESLLWLENLESFIPDHNEFVASNFSHFYPAWKELLKGVNRKSARSVLSWLKSGFKPKFAGTQSAKPKKREKVTAMLRKVEKPGQVEHLLSGRYPHRVEFQNHQSLY